MTADFDPRTVPISNAATVMLIRDGSDGIEVFMLRRTMAAVFAGGLYVFPGGRVDAADSSPALAAVCHGLDDAAASTSLDIVAGGLAYWVGAIRECFEEAGVLLAADSNGEVVRFDEPQVEQRFNAYRHEVHEGHLALEQLCHDEGLVLTPGAIGYVAHWVTPMGERRRFDTRFFVARAPQAQTPLHDDGETIESLWVQPVDALARLEAGDLAMLPPTKACLELLAGFTTADDVLEHVATMPPPPRILPKGTFDAAGRFVGLVFPWDPGYDEMEEYTVV